MTWKEFTYRLVCEYCNSIGSRTFTLQDFFEVNEELFARFKPNNNNILPKVRQQLQFLRNDGLISFADNRGTYTLRGIEILENEIEEAKIAEVSRSIPEKREYLIETYARNRGWVEEAKNVFGCYCMLAECNNTFPKEDGSPYIEVHHIIPLHKGGEDGIWNLSVICAHHHKMAHFSDLATRSKLEKTLLNENNYRLKEKVNTACYI